MEDVPQPPRDPYAVGEQVQIYLGTSDLDSQFHGTVCKVIEATKDDLDSETDRAIDAYRYTLQNVKTKNTLPILFRHRDLVPSGNSH